MQKIIFILGLLLISCNSGINDKNDQEHTQKTQDQKENFELKPLHPYTYEFEGEKDKLNRIDYYYISGDFQYNTADYDKLKKIIEAQRQSLKTDYYLYSIYVFHETDELNESYNKTREYFGAKYKDMAAYIRYKNGVKNIFYILKDSYVIYDYLKTEKVDFEFEG